MVSLFITSKSNRKLRDKILDEKAITVKWLLTKVHKIRTQKMKGLEFIPNNETKQKDQYKNSRNGADRTTPVQNMLLVQNTKLDTKT